MTENTDVENNKIHYRVKFFKSYFSKEKTGSGWKQHNISNLKVIVFDPNTLFYSVQAKEYFMQTIWSSFMQQFSASVLKLHTRRQMQREPVDFWHLEDWLGFVWCGIRLGQDRSTEYLDTCCKRTMLGWCNGCIIACIFLKTAHWRNLEEISWLRKEGC